MTPSTISVPPRCGVAGGKEARPAATVMWRTSANSAVVPSTGTARLRSPTRTFSVPAASGAAERTRGSRMTACRSSRVRSCTTPPNGAAPVVSTLPGMAMSRFDPRAANSLVT